MDTQDIILSQHEQLAPSEQPFHRTMTMQEAATSWLSKYTGRTENIYRETMLSFGQWLNQAGLSFNADPGLISAQCERWARYSLSGKTLSNGTVNQRFAVVSSFYQYACKKGACAVNPIDLSDREKRDVQHAAPYLPKDYVLEKLSQIDTSTSDGRRDKMLIYLACITGRRYRELAHLACGDIEIRAGEVAIYWRHCKGGKLLINRYDKSDRSIQMLLKYIELAHGPAPVPETIVFPSYSNRSRGKPLSHQGMSQIYLKRLGVSTIHSSRHAFAVALDEAGASISDIGDALGHSNYQTTSSYMQRTKAGKLKHLKRLEDAFGIDEQFL